MIPFEKKQSAEMYELLLKRINNFLGCDPYPPKTLETSMDELVYLGGGYWRLIPLFDLDETRLRGVILVNPDYTGPQIKSIEQTYCLLNHIEWKEI
jgi:hypothetical protein